MEMKKATESVRKLSPEWWKNGKKAKKISDFVKFRMSWARTHPTRAVSSLSWNTSDRQLVRLFQADLRCALLHTADLADRPRWIIYGARGEESHARVQLGIQLHSSTFGSLPSLPDMLQKGMKKRQRVRGPMHISNMSLLTKNLSNDFVLK